MTDRYKDCVIKNIRRGIVVSSRPSTRGRDKIIYADLYAADGELLISATLDYITDALKDRICQEKTKT